ncbi:hypothetical protein SAZ11_08955 [Streptomyces sp. FXJ1.4098]|nr:hypothetical protein [Streptomyces sp. FXJ1.4098]
MTPEEFVNGLTVGGSTNIADENDDIEYCPTHGYEHGYIGDLYHEDTCRAYASKIARLIA